MTVSIRSRSLVAFIALVSINQFAVNAALGNDIVVSEDVVSGSSVFVFRESRRRPQESSGGSSKWAASPSRAQRERANAQIAASRKRKAEAAKARQDAIARARARERVAKLKLSNTLAAAGEKQMESGDISGAIVSFRDSLKANPKNPEAMAGLSEALTVTGIQSAGERLDPVAIPLFEEAVKLDPKNAVAFAKLGDIYSAKGNNGLAADNYSKAIAIDPELSSLYLPAALAYVETGDLLKAEHFLTKAESAGIDTAEARYLRALLLIKQNKLNEALAVFDHLASMEPNNADLHLQRGSIFLKLGQNQKAVEAFRRVTQIQPINAAAWFELGVIYYNSGDLTNAVLAYQASIKADPTNARTHANLASAFRQLERFREAIAEYEIAAQTIKDDPNLYSEWGYCLGKVAEWDRAAAQLETANTVGGTAADGSNVGWAYYNAAQKDKAAKNDEAAQRKLEKARGELERSVEKDPKLEAAHLNLGSTYNSLGEHEKAVVALNEALRLHNDWVIALNQLGLAYRGSNNLPLALAQFNRVVVLDGNNVAGLFNLGSAQYASGDKKGAQKTQARLKKIRPDLADQLGYIIAGKAIDIGTQKLRQKVRIPGIPF